MSVEANTVYDVQIEILRTDTGSRTEYATIKLNKHSFGKCDPGGDDFDCTYGNCSALTQRQIIAETTRIEVEIQFTDTVGTGYGFHTCMVENNNARGAARITLTPNGELKIIRKLS